MGMRGSRSAVGSGDDGMKVGGRECRDGRVWQSRKHLHAQHKQWALWLGVERKLKGSGDDGH